MLCWSLSDRILGYICNIPFLSSVTAVSVNYKPNSNEIASMYFNVKSCIAQSKLPNCQQKEKNGKTNEQTN